MKTKENIVEKKESIVRSDLRVSVVHALEKEMATRSSVLAWRIPGMGEPGGGLWGHTQSDTTEATQQQQQQLVHKEYITSTTALMWQTVNLVAFVEFPPTVTLGLANGSLEGLIPAKS